MITISLTGIVGGVLLLSIFLAVKRVPLGDAATIFYSGNSWFIRHFEFDMKGKVYWKFRELILYRIRPSAKVFIFEIFYHFTFFITAE